MSSQKKILFVFTSADKNLVGGATGWYLPEAAHPYYILNNKFQIDFAAPKGPNPPIDEASITAWKEDAECAKFLVDPAVKSKFETAQTLTQINANDYEAIFYVGGHGPILDLASDSANAKLASEFWQAGKLVSAVCHGTGALVGAVDTSGKSIFEGRAFTGFSNHEEGLMKALDAVPFLLETKLTELGGKYEKAADPWKSHTTVDGQLYTGQNPASAGPLGELILKALST